MNDWQGNKRMTVREVAKALGCHPDTVRVHIRELWPDFMKNGVATYLTETQVTIILEKMKQGLAHAHHVSGGDVAAYESGIIGTETSQSRVLKLQILQKQMQDIYESEIAELKAKAEADRPKVEFFDAVADSADALQMRDVASILNMEGWGRNSIFALLRKKRVFDERNIPYREYQDRGYFRVIEQKWTTSDGETRINLKPLVYQGGVDFIRKLILKQAGERLALSSAEAKLGRAN